MLPDDETAPVDGPPATRRERRTPAADTESTRETAKTQTLDDLIAPENAEPDKPKRRRRIWPWVLGILLALILIVAVAGVFAVIFFGQASDARAALNDAKKQLATLSTQLKDGDEAAVAATAQQITASTTEAADIVDGPLWDVAARVPFVGQNVDAVQRVTRAVDTLVQQALPPGMQVMTAMDFDKITVEGGGINLEPFRQAQGALPAISEAFTAAEAQVAPIDRSQLLPIVAEPIDDILSIIQQAAPTLDVVNRYMPTLLDMAGSGGTKTYLVIFQNNAEIRATGATRPRA